MRARGPRRIVSAVAGLALVLGAAPPAYADGYRQSSTRQTAFAAAAREFGVPEPVLLALSYHESRWEAHAGQPSTSGGYGPMHLTDISVPAADGDARGDGMHRSTAALAHDPALHSLQIAASLIGVSPALLRSDARQNIRGGAALLAHYARASSGGTLPDGVGGWYAAVAKYNGSVDVMSAEAFADDVFATIHHGATRTTQDGQTVRLAASPWVSPDKRAGPAAVRHASGDQAECPPDLDCRFIPAAYQLNNPNDPADYGNYDYANRPDDGNTISYIVIHDTEGSYEGAIAVFRNPHSHVSAHYVIRSSDGQITQMVRSKDVAWQAGNWHINMHSIGIEHEGFAAEGAAWYTEALYRASARLVRYLTGRFGIPLDRTHIIGHDEVPGPTPDHVPRMHWDPGPFWDWAHYMELLGAPVGPSGAPHSRVITISPHFATNQPPVSACDRNGCRQLPRQPANFLYLRTEPSESAPLLSDPALHPDGRPGTNRANDWGDKAVTGQSFVVADRSGDWTAVWYGGQKGWLHDPGGKATTPGGGLLVTPRPGLAAIPVYGRAYPEAEAYPNEIPVRPLAPLQYTIPAGQLYVVGRPVSADYYYATTYDDSAPSDHTLVQGRDRYLLISFNHRVAYVKASDVQSVTNDA